MYCTYVAFGVVYHLVVLTIPVILVKVWELIATVYISFFIVDEHYITNILKVYNKGEIAEILKIKILKLTQISMAHFACTPFFPIMI